MRWERLSLLGFPLLNEFGMLSCALRAVLWGNLPAAWETPSANGCSPYILKFGNLLIPRL